MKKTFQAGTGILGEGNPKICVPVVAGTREAIWKKAEEIALLPADIVEWRADFYEDIFQSQTMQETLQGLKERLNGKALLFTFRTKEEGGNQSISRDAYHQLNESAASAGADLVDVEAFLEEERTADKIRRLKEAGCRVIASSHDFDRTPPVKEMVRRLLRMEEMGADAAKLAVMPVERQDVLELLKATVMADERLSIPVITMSMGSLGAVSRICGSLTGSAMTFASVGETSAPGQIPIESMQAALRLLECGR